MKSNSKYYSGDYLLTLKDKDKSLPEIYICDGNRTAGKSYYFKSRLIDTFINKKGVNEFIYLYRYKTDMNDCANNIFGDIAEKYKGYEMTEKKLADGAVVKLMLNGVQCGFCLALSMATKYKKMSALFVNVAHMFFDEYQDEDGNYLDEEPKKLQSIHTTVARGHGEQTRRVPLYMCSNTVSILNPYYNAFGINKQLKKSTKYLRGTGWVFERTFNENASQAYKASSFNRAFGDSSYNKYAAENVYLNDNMALIGKPDGYSTYLLSVLYNGEWYNIRRYSSCIYVSTGADQTYPSRICFNVDDVVDDRSLMVSSSSFIVVSLRTYFNKGLMRFENLKCKNMALDLLSYM